MIEIKKYSNRRLYNTQTSNYITLDDIVELIKTEKDFKVIDADTKANITSTILTQIILERETAGTNLIPEYFLKQIILFHENKKNADMFGFLTNIINPSNSNGFFKTGFPNFMDFNFFNLNAKEEKKKETQSKNIDELLNQIDKLKKEVEDIKTKN